MSVFQATSIILGVFLAYNVRQARIVSYKTVELAEDFPEVEIGKEEDEGSALLQDEAKGHEEKKADSRYPTSIPGDETDATLEEGFVGARGVNDSSLEMGLYAGVSTKTDDDWNILMQMMSSVQAIQYQL